MCNIIFYKRIWWNVRISEILIETFHKTATLWDMAKHKLVGWFVNSSIVDWKISFVVKSLMVKSFGTYNQRHFRLCALHLQRCILSLSFSFRFAALRDLGRKHSSSLFRVYTKELNLLTDRLWKLLIEQNCPLGILLRTETEKFERVVST